MANTITKIPFKGTKEQQEELFKAIDRYSGQSGALIPVLQEAQKIYGYLPYEVQKMIAEKLNVSMEKVYEVVTLHPGRFGQDGHHWQLVLHIQVVKGSHVTFYYPVN